MIKRLLLSALLALSLLAPAAVAPFTASAADCQFVLGFKTIHDAMPDVVGDCTVDEHHNPTNGDGLQETTGPTGKGGLLVWRKADNWTAYTDGYWTWVNGPNGLQKRLNTDRFPFEHDTTAPAIGQQTKTSGCQSVNALSDPACTPGAIFATATADQICVPGYSTSVRDVPDSEKKQAYAEYGIATHTTGQYEVDHLIPLELGGSNALANMWPEPAEPRPGFHEKDRVENYLHAQVCSGAMPLQDAQLQIATNWLSVYERMPK